MVHVMSEVKPCKHGRNFCVDCHMSSDQMYSAAEALRPENQRVYPIGTQRDWQSELDAQRLRADTAEVERDELKKHQGILLQGAKYARSRRDYWLRRGDRLQNELAAAEQRITELTDVERVTMAILGKDKDPSPGVNWNVHRMWRVNDVRELVRAALNPNTEAESHE